MVLVDTSVWIRFLANRAPYAAVLYRLLGLDEVTAKHLDRIDKVDAMLENIGSALRLVPFEVHWS